MTPTRILIVEDERIVALHLKQQLLKLGYEVAGVAASGPAALQHIAQLNPDVVLMDIHIEGDMDGIETAGRISPDLELPVIYLTAYSEEATLERARATKPYGYLIKPYSERELHATIQMALERRRAASALRASEERFRSIVNAISEGIFILDAGTERFTEVNAPGSTMFGYQDHELVDCDIAALSSGTRPYTRHEAAEWLRKAAATGQPQRFDWHCRAKDGHLFWAEFSVRLAKIGGRDVVISVARDLTERRAIEEQLLQAQKMEALGELTGGLAHDFNNLLGVVIGNLDLLRSGPRDEAERDELSSDALQAALGGAELTRQLLAFARRQPLKPQLVDLDVLIRGTARLLRRTLGDNIEISLELADEVCCVLADQIQLEAALTNLAVNARDAMPDGGRLLFATGRRHLDADYVANHPDVVVGDYAMIEVTDTGAGMTPEVMGHIFEPFYTTRGRDQGTGLGLSMVFGFLKQSGGHVSAYSEVGVGSTFRLYLPCSQPAEPARAARPAPPAAASRGESVLVVEDNPSLRRLAVRELGRLGYQVLQAENGPEAMARLEAAKVDLLFTDIVMPGGIDGVELAGAAVARWPGLKVVLTSGFPAARLSERLAATTFQLLNKPYRQEDLAKMVRAVLDETDAGGVDA